MRDPCFRRSLRHHDRASSQALDPAGVGSLIYPRDAPASQPHLPRTRGILRHAPNCLRSWIDQRPDLGRFAAELRRQVKSEDHLHLEPQALPFHRSPSRSIHANSIICDTRATNARSPLRPRHPHRHGQKQGRTGWHKARIKRNTSPICVSAT